MAFLPSVIHARHAGGYCIRVRFNDNSEATIDFSQWLDGPIFEPLRDLRYFSSFYLDGGTVVWPNGADIAPETLYEFSKKPVPKTRSPKRVISHS